MYNRRKLPARGSITLNKSDTVLRREEHMTCIINVDRSKSPIFSKERHDRVLCSLARVAFLVSYAPSRGRRGL